MSRHGCVVLIGVPGRGQEHWIFSGGCEASIFCCVAQALTSAAVFMPQPRFQLARQHTNQCWPSLSGHALECSLLILGVHIYTVLNIVHTGKYVQCKMQGVP